VPSAFVALERLDEHPRAGRRVWTRTRQLSERSRIRRLTPRDDDDVPADRRDIKQGGGSADGLRWATSPRWAAPLNAILLDGVILGLATGVLLSLLGTAARSPDALLLIFGLQFLYFFALEAATGQTVGKRAFHVRVVALDGTPVTTR
jgi:hypothetical protein